MTEQQGKTRGFLGRLIREPLLHFLVLGGLIYAAFLALNTDTLHPDSANTITVDRATLLNYMQYRAKAFEADYFSAQLDKMSPAERQSLIDDYVQEEALYKEANAMGLGTNDYVIRQRVIQSLKFLIQDASENMEPPTAQELETYYAANKDVYTEPANYTFTHVFFDSSTHGDAKAKQMAEDLLPKLRAGVTFDQAPQYGERFPFFTNYVERRRDFVVSHFGEPMIKELDKLDPDHPQWQGPFQSPYGWHLVLLTKRTPPRLPDLTELKDRVVEDYRRDRKDASERAAIARIVDRYKVRIAEDLK